MSKDDWEDVTDDMIVEDGALDTEEARDAVIDFIVSQNEEDDWIQAQAIQDGENLIARFRWADGREYVFDLIVRREMEIVRPDGAGSN